MSQKVPWPGLDDEALLLAVANTAHGEHDELADADAIHAWWRGLGAPAAAWDARPEAVGSVTTMRMLRVLIRGLALRNNGVEPDLSEASGLDALALRLDLAGALTLRAAEPGDL